MDFVNDVSHVEITTIYGITLKMLREEKRLTQSQLCKADDPHNYICSVRTLSRIEKGEIPLSDKYLSGFLSVLGISHTDFYYEVDGGKKTTLFLNAFSDVWDLLFKKKRSEAKAKMKSLIADAVIDLEKPLIKQAIMLYEYREKAEYGDDDTDCMEELCMALSLTSAYIVAGNEIAFAQVASGTFKLNEYRIMNVIASEKVRKGDMATSVEIFKALKESLENKTLPSEIRNKMLPTICYNLADALTDRGEYKEAAKISEAGLSHGKKVGSHRIDGLLYYSMAKAQYFLDEKDKAAGNFKSSYYSHKVQGKDEMAEMVKKFALEKYDVNIE